MLADAVEAAAKTIDKPTPLKLEQLIRSLIKEKLDDGQLSESRLTLGDLEKITKTFTRILSAMYHTRVEYPALVKEEDIS
jgi:membrane-associated HD superfamily phosphohydrolase